MQDSLLAQVTTSAGLEAESVPHAECDRENIQKEKTAMRSRFSISLVRKSKEEERESIGSPFQDNPPTEVSCVTSDDVFFNSITSFDWESTVSFKRELIIFRLDKGPLKSWETL